MKKRDTENDDENNDADGDGQNQRISNKSSSIQKEGGLESSVQNSNIE